MKKPEYTEKYKGYTINIYQDDNADSPDDWGNEDIFLVYEHRDFTVERRGFYPIDIYNHRQNNKDDEDFNEYDRPEFNDYYIFPVDMYSHSGIHLSLANTRNYPDRRWDVSTTGYVLVNKYYTEHFTNTTYEYTLERATIMAEGIIIEWNDYLSGNVWGYEITLPIKCDTCEHIEPKYIDSCWGFYGEYINALNEAKSFIDGIKE